MKNKIIFKTLMLKGEAGSTIVSMEKTGHVGTADIYTITFNDGSTTEISLENMSAITSVEKTSSTDTEDIYTITCADGSTQTFSVLNHNADIAALSASVSAEIDTIDARVDNFINSVVPDSVETLWTGSLGTRNQPVTLSKSVSEFDFIDIYTLNGADTTFTRVPANVGTANIHCGDLSNDASIDYFYYGEMGITFNGNQATLTKAVAFEWTPKNPQVVDDTTIAVVTRIDGVKIASNTPAELTDIRVGANGTTYASAGAAVRGQYTELKENLIHELNSKNSVTSGTVTNGKYVNQGTGQLLDGNFTASDFLPVIQNTKVGISRGIGQFAFYDINKEYVSGVPVASTIHDYIEYVVPSTAVYVRFTLSNSFTHSKLYYTITNGEKCPLEPFVIVGSNDLNVPDFKRIRDAVLYAEKWHNITVFIQAGTYDLITEFSSEISQSPTSQIGISLKNGIHIIGESGTVITGNYDGDDHNVVTNFSPFFTKDGGGFTLENLVIQAKNCRYCVHDEYSSGDVVSVNKYINCNMFMDYSAPPTGMENLYHQCIGGGCAKHSYVYIVGCIFKTKAAENTSKLAVSYHNAYTSGAQSRIIIANSYFADLSTVRFGHYGLSTDMSEGIVQNCSLGAAPILRKEVPNQTTPDNFTLLSYNNEVR